MLIQDIIEMLMSGKRELQILKQKKTKIKKDFGVDLCKD